MPEVTLAEQLVLQHRAKRWRDRHGELERHFVPDEPLHHSEQRDVTLRYRLEEPVFLEKLVMLRMPDKRQMRVKKEREVTGGHLGMRNSDFRIRQSVLQKSWNRSRPFLMTSMLVA